MITALDTKVLLDVLIPAAAHAETSKRTLDEASAAGALAISEVVYAELAAQFDAREELDGFLSATRIALVASSPDALHRAGEAWRSYCHQRRRQGALRCTACGAEQSIACRRCQEPLRLKQHVLADFLVGAHAFVHAQRLATRDLGYYRKYFPKLQLWQATAPSE